eukprot:5612933-Amphidinium_carterae.1
MMLNHLTSVVLSCVLGGLGEHKLYLVFWTGFKGWKNTSCILLLLDVNVCIREVHGAMSRESQDRAVILPGDAFLLICATSVSETSRSTCVFDAGIAGATSCSTGENRAAAGSFRCLGRVWTHGRRGALLR